MWQVKDTMITRALLVTLWCVCAGALTPLSAAADDNDCALYLSGPGRTSAFDYSLNLLRGNFGYEGQHTCITYEAINQAYLDARKRILVSQPKGDWKPEDYASVGELVLDISISLARTYGLTYEEIEKGLPLIDTSRTLIREACPPVFSHVECRAGKYRRMDGLCNNLEHPTWGATNAPFQRLIGPLFADGINAPRISHTGRDLPLSRVVSRTMHPDDGFHDHAGTVMVIAWGQFMDHDYTLTGTPLDPKNRNDPEECCKRPPHLKHPYCNEIRVPDDDYFYRLFGVKCIDFVRAFPSPRPGCRLGSRVPFNTLTGAIDGNTVYGVTEKFARKLRTGYGGLLRMNPVFKEYGLKDLLPLKLDIPDEGCTRPNKNMYCFEAGEIRVNEQLVLTVMHTLMAREHNRVAKGLAEVNPHWDDETLFQEARRINIAEIQHITYNEFLPILLGKDVMDKFGLVLEKEGYWNGYDPTVNPDVIDSFASAAYRFGHSLLPTAVERWSKAHKFIASKRLSDLIRRPYDLYRAGVLDEYVMGLMNQVAQAMDDSITQEVTNHLFKKVGARFGMDLVSFNMQRGREFGIPGYMEFRKFCGLSGAETFQDLFGSMPNETVRRYESIFEHPIDVDLWSGGVSERPLPGSMLGPTFACVIATQFSYSRRGDRFWFELPNQPSSFTPEQLAELRKARLARVICDNTDIIDTVQLYPMVLPDHELNPRVPCRSGIIPSMDFTKWAEPAPFQGAAKQFITEAFFASNEDDKSAGNNTAHQIKDIETQTTHNADNNTTILNNATIPATDTITNETIIKCGKNNSAQNCSKDLKETNEINGKDTVMKYVSGKNDESIPQKNSGHIRNSLRRKRSLDNIISNSAPEIVNYETKHSPREREIAIPLLQRNDLIKSSDLADFNIETLHDPVQGDYSKENKESDDLPSTKLTPNLETSDESGERVEKNDEIRKPRTEDSSNETIDGDNIESNERTEYSKKSLPANSGESFERDDLKSPLTRSNNTESQESRENSDENDEKSDYVNPRGRNIDSNEDEYNNRESIPSRQRYSNNDSKENEKVSIYLPTDNSNEDKGTNYPPGDHSDEVNEKPRDELKQLNFGDSDKGVPRVIQDVDLDDFSYERIQINDKGKVEPAKDTQENNDDDDDSREEQRHNKSEEREIPRSEYIEKKNNGEIKPVVEINTESNSDEFSDENVEISRPQNADFKNDDRSLETVLGVTGSDSSENNEKIVQKTEEPPSENVKQEFERIPLNYKHDKKPTDHSSDSDRPTDKTINGDIPPADGTLETLLPKEHGFDENLNFKFDDVSIKLPEIKLPGDILSYAYESPYKQDSKSKPKAKPKFYHYSDEHSDENPLKHVPKYDDDQGYYKYDAPVEKEYYKKQEKHNDEENDDAPVDLYEKFVRERFGKRGSFEKRSEQLREEVFKPSDPKLRETLQHIRERSEASLKEAKKSRDPKAGYMWTLEYGQNL